MTNRTTQDAALQAGDTTRCALNTLYQVILDALDDSFAPETCRRLDDALDAARAVLGRAAQ
jgi:hypothetical protein